MLHMCTCITRPTLMQIIDKRPRPCPTHGQRMTLTHASPYVSFSPMQRRTLSSECLHIKPPQKCKQVCLKKKKCDPGKAPPFLYIKKARRDPRPFFFKNRKKEKVYDVLNPNFVELCYSRRWVRKDYKNNWIEELKSVTFVDTRETFQTPTKSAPSFRNVLEKIHIEVTHKINNFALKV